MTATAVNLSGKRILITGATGFVAQPIVAALAKNNEVFAGARYKKPEDKNTVTQLGATPVYLDLGAEEWHDLPEEIDYVLNLAVAKSGKWHIDLPVNAESLGRLMLHYRDVDAFLHISSTAVYEYAGHEPRSETSPLGDNHRNLFETYSISKIAAETVARFVAKEFEIPLTIARLNVPYGPFPCWPYFHLMMMQNGMPIDVHPEAPNGYTPIHSNDYVQKIPYLLGAASIDATTVNLAGKQHVSIEEWCAYMQELTGFEPVFNKTDKALGNLTADTTKMNEVIGAASMDWKDGIKNMIEVMAPQLLK
jgi:nucleoside-diphosphate-sugar epimerase